MSSSWGLRFAATCGALYPIVLIVGDDVIAHGDKLAPDAGTPREVADNVAQVGDAFFVGRGLGMTSAVLLVVFAAYAATRLRSARGPESLWPTLAVAGGAIAAALQLNSSVAQLSLARHGGAGADPDLMVALLDLGAGFVLAMLPLTLLVAAVAVDGLSGEQLIIGRTLGWIGAALAVALPVGCVAAVAGADLGFLPLPLSWLWFVAVGVSAVRRVPRAADVPDGATAEALRSS